MKFIITGLPRSGTTWLSVFLTTDDCLCLHEPTVTLSPEELEVWEGGVSDTSLWFLPEWCKHHTDKIVYVDRKVDEINASLLSKGLPSLPNEIVEKFRQKKEGLVVYYENLFTPEIAEEIWNYVYPEKQFNLQRWNSLKDIHMSPNYMEIQNERFTVPTKV